MAIKIKYTHFRLFALVLVIIIAAMYVNSEGFQLIQKSKDISFSSYLKGAPANLVSYESYTNYECVPIKLQRSTIQCKADPTVTEETDQTIATELERKDEDLPNYILNVVVPEDTYYYNNFYNQWLNGYVASVNIPEEPSWLGNGNWVTILDASTGNIICSVQWYNFVVGGSYSDSCSGGQTKLQKGRTYNIVSNVENVEVTFAGVPAFLFYSNPDVGQIDIKMPGTENCFYYSWKTVLNEIEDDIGVETTTDVFSNININGRELSDDEENIVIEELKTPGSVDNPDVQAPSSFSEVPTVDDSGSILAMERLNLGFTWTHPYAYVEKAQIIPGAINYDGYLAECRINEQRVVGYFKEPVGDNKCYFRPDSSATLVNGNPAQNSFYADKHFCCRTSDCLPLGQRWACKDFYCQLDVDPDDTCNGDDECPSQYYTRGDGQDLWREGICEYDDELGYDTCTYTDYEVGCNPTKTYPGDQCCKVKDGKYQLLSGEDCDPPGLKVCEDVFGLNACCLESQSTYSFKPCTGNLECCGAETDGIGECKETCEGPKPLTFWEHLINFMKETFGTNENLAIIIAVVLGIIIFLIIIKAILPMITMPYIRGPPPYGGGGFTGGGGGIIIVR